jgi:hypothetical protein
MFHRLVGDDMCVLKFLTTVSQPQANTPSSATVPAAGGDF